MKTKSKTSPKNLSAPLKKSNRQVAVFKQKFPSDLPGVSGETLLSFSNLTLHFPWDHTGAALFPDPVGRHWECLSGGRGALSQMMIPRAPRQPGCDLSRACGAALAAPRSPHSTKSPAASQANRDSCCPLQPEPPWSPCREQQGTAAPGKGQCLLQYGPA